MKRLIASVVVIVALAAAFETHAQTRPNFSGRWVQVSPAEGAGSEQVIKHEGDKMTASHASTGDGHVLEYTLDGTEKTQTLTSHGQDLNSKVRAIWEKESVVITATTHYGGDRTVTLKQVWSLDKAGQLVIVVSPTVDGKHQDPITLVHTRKPSH
jgi:hypothetical protein